MKAGGYFDKPSDSTTASCFLTDDAILAILILLCVVYGQVQRQKANCY